jgi:hypothetical protein
MEPKQIDIRIGQDIISKATVCTNDFSCVSGDKSCLCEIESHPKEPLYFLTHLNNKRCNYSYVFGYYNVCLCPVRQEIYKRYRV